MPQNYETPTSAAGYDPMPAVVVEDSSATYSGGAAYDEGATPTSGQSTKDVAKDQAAAVGTTAADKTKQVAGTAKDQAANVASEAAAQTKNLIGQTRSQLQDQAVQQQQRVASGIRSLSGELSSMADRSDQSGIASDLVREVSERAETVATWLEQRDPGNLVEELRSFARRRPGAFLAIAAGAGLAAGRLTRGTVDASRDSGSGTSSTETQSYSSAYGTPSYGTAGYGTTAGQGTYTEGTYPAGTDYQEVPPTGTGYAETTYVETTVEPIDDPVIEGQNQSGGRP